MYVIRLSNGQYVRRPGEQSSYTCFLQQAWTFATREAAQRQICPENETVVSVSDILQPGDDQ